MAPTSSVADRLSSQLNLSISSTNSAARGEARISVTGSTVKGRVIGFLQNLKGIKNLSYFQQHRVEDARSQHALLQSISQNSQSPERTGAIVHKFGLDRFEHPRPLTSRTLGRILDSLNNKEVMVKQEPPTARAERGAIALDATIASIPYHGDFGKVDSVSNEFFGNAAGWDTARELSSHVAVGTGLKSVGHQGLMYDKKSGLTAYVLQNPAQKELRVVFGGTTSGKHFGGLGSRQINNSLFTANHWRANVKNATSNSVPDSYKQAAEVTQAVIDMAKSHPSYKEYTVKTSGHSKGGGEAAFAALKSSGQKQPDGTVVPTKAICFSSAEFGRGIISSLTEDEKAIAVDSVVHYNISGDIVPKMGKLLPGLSHFGKVVTLPPSSRLSSPLDRHDKFHEHSLAFAQNAEE